jgi:enoyl-CoA hydratase/carnithine racemase
MNLTRVNILTGSGEKSFVAGAVLQSFVHFTTDEGKDWRSTQHGNPHLML